MDDAVEGQLGVIVIHDPPGSTIDIVAVHGLGANPAWAWTRKVEHGNEELKINWLADKHLLPAAIPNARIMTFNYESRWHSNAPWQRRSLCANQLLTALDNHRRKETGDKIRPIIFIGHSFGGIVIEEAIIQGNLDSSFQHLSKSTAGIIFLGTPHRGTEASKWGELIAVSGRYLGFGSEDSILKDLRKDSGTLSDLLYQFTLWLFRFSVPTVCFFEQYKTDYGKRISFLRWEEMVVDERTACIDGHRKVPLPTDHFKINKFEGPDDPCYKTVAPIIAEMAKQAYKNIQARLQPRTIAHDDSLVSPENLKCLQYLFLTNPLDDLAAIRRTKGERIDDTCEWLLVHEDYTAWSVGADSQVLRMIGGPGIGKTMISLFLVDELKQKAEKTPSMTLAYYFCDNKDEMRNTDLAILRGLLLQFLRQLPILFKHIKPDYDQQQDKLFTNFDALWRILLNIFEDPDAGEIYILIDALDECEKSLRKNFLTVLANLLDSPRLAKMKLKLLITSRPESDIESSLLGFGKQLQVDSGKVNADLAKFIDFKVDELSIKRNYPAKLAKEVRSALTRHAGGTFLWASLVLKDLSETTALRLVSKKLQSLPSGINEVYDKILREIKSDYRDIAKTVLQWVVLARRPLTMEELAMALALTLALTTDEYEEDTLPPKEDLDLFKEDFRCCEPLIYHDTSSNTLNLVHQSAKDYLLSNHLQSNTSLSYYRVKEDETHLIIFQTCWRYLSVKDFEHGSKIIQRYGNMLEEIYISKEYFNTYKFLQYAAKEWQEHAIAAYRVLGNDFEWDRLNLCKASTLRDVWLIKAALCGQEAIVRLLLEKGAELETKDRYGWTPLSWAARNGQEAVVRLLLEKGAELEIKDRHGQTPLSWAAMFGQEAVVRLLQEKGAELETEDQYGGTPLSFAAGNAQEVVVRLLLEKGAELETKDEDGQTPLSWAARYGREAVVRLLLEKGAELETKDQYGGRTPLSWAVRNRKEAVVRLLLEKGAKLETKDEFGQTPLSWAAENGQEAVVRLLLEKGAELATKDRYGYTPLSWAARSGQEAVVRLLLEKGAKLETKDKSGQTPLSWAAGNGQEAVVRLLLEKGAELEIKDRHGQTPLSWAAMFGQEAVVRLLQEKSAEKL